jgi:hypothetical protein
VRRPVVSSHATPRWSRGPWTAGAGAGFGTPCASHPPPRLPSPSLRPPGDECRRAWVRWWWDICSDRPVANHVLPLRGRTCYRCTTALAPWARLACVACTVLCTHNRPTEGALYVYLPGRRQAGTYVRPRYALSCTGWVGHSGLYDTQLDDCATSSPPRHPPTHLRRSGERRA